MEHRSPKLAVAFPSEAMLRRLEPRQLCRVARCGRKTAEGKPFCIEHLDKLPYVRTLRRELAARAAEERVAATPNGSWAVSVHGARAKEIVQELARGARTTERLALTTELTPAALAGYLEALERAGLVRVLTLGSIRGALRQVVVLADGQDHRRSSAAAAS